MKKMFKVMLLVLCAALLVAGSVMGTLAYLQMKTDTVKNTFTVGKVSITLDEAKTDVLGVALTGNDAARIPNANDDAVGNEYKLIPGHTYTKDPTIHVEAGSESCYLFVQIANGIEDIEAPSDAVAGTYTIEDQMIANGWVLMEDWNSYEIWYKSEKVVVGNVNVDVVIFENFTINAAVVDISDYQGETIKITGYAVQAEGFNSAAEAWEGSTFSDPV